MRPMPLMEVAGVGAKHSPLRPRDWRNSGDGEDDVDDGEEDENEDGDEFETGNDNVDKLLEGKFEVEENEFPQLAKCHNDQ